MQKQGVWTQRLAHFGDACSLKHLVLFFTSPTCPLSLSSCDIFASFLRLAEVNGNAISPSLLEKVFERAHRYYSAGIRLYFGTIPGVLHPRTCPLYSIRLKVVASVFVLLCSFAFVFHPFAQQRI